MYNKSMSKTYDTPGPAIDGYLNQEPYAPVECEFTDDLEHLSVKRIEVEIFHFDETGKREQDKGLITDIKIVNKADYLVLSSGKEIRLDRIQFIRSSFQSQRQGGFRC